MSNNWKKPQDYENRVPSSVHHLSQVKSTTMFQGLNYPILFQKVLAGDRWSIDMADLIQSDPFLAPVKGAYRLTFSVWYESDFNLYGWMRDNDQQSTYDLLQTDRHKFNIPAIALGVLPKLSGTNPNYGNYYAEQFINNVSADPTNPLYTDGSTPTNWAAGEVVDSYSEFGATSLPDFRDPNTSGPLRVVPGTSTVVKPGCVGRGSLLDYVGFAPGFQGAGSDAYGDGFGTYFAADYLLAYFDIMRCGFLNTQTVSDIDGSSFIPVVGNGPVLESLSKGPNSFDSVNSSYFYELTTRKLDGFFKWLRNLDDPAVFNQGIDYPDFFSSLSSDEIWDPEGIEYGSDRYWVYFFNQLVRISMYPNGGLCAAQYRPDVYRNLLSTDVGSVKSFVETDSSGRFTIDTLRFKNKLQRVIDRFDISGGRISSWLRTLWGVETRRRFTTPELLGVTSHILDPSTITALSQTGEVGAAGSTDVGQLRGNIDKLKEHKKISFVASEPGTIVVIAQLVPIVSYCQNIDPALRRTSFSDDYNPEFAQLGFQDVPMSDYSCLTTTEGSSPAEDLFYYKPFVNVVSPEWEAVQGTLDHVVGRNIAWVHYMTGTNRCHGEFSNLGSRDYWVFQRRYTRYYETTSYYYPFVQDSADDLVAAPFESATTLGAKTYISPYVDPLDYQYPFADQTLLDPHFQLDVAFNLRVVRKIGKRFMPNLERND